jgi:DNA-binding GntR family transcriptional regulator
MARKSAGKPPRGGRDLESAVRLLKAEIQQGRLVPGQRLVESDMMEHLGVTRGRVREVFKRLEADGLVQIEKNRGASVRKISREEVRQVTEILEDISLLMINKVGRRIDDAQTVKRLKESLEAVRRFDRASSRISRVQEYMDENARFWGELAALAGNPILSDIRLRLQTLLFRFAMEGLTVSSDREKWEAWHEEILVALLRGETAQAVRYAKKSMHEVWDAILGLPDSAFGR